MPTQGNNIGFNNIYIPHLNGASNKIQDSLFSPQQSILKKVFQLNLIIRCSLLIHFKKYYQLETFDNWRITIKFRSGKN